MTLWDAGVFKMFTGAFAFHPVGLLIVVAALGYFIWKKYPISKSILYAVAVMYGMLFLEFMIFPTFGTREVSFQLIPFHTIREVWVEGLGQDIETFRFMMGLIALIPLGFLLPFFYQKLKGWKMTGAFALLIPLGIEIVQVIVALIFGGVRVFDVDDIILGMIGLLIGFLLHALFATVSPRLTARLKKGIAS